MKRIASAAVIAVGLHLLLFSVDVGRRDTGKRALLQPDAVLIDLVAAPPQVARPSLPSSALPQTPLIPPESVAGDSEPVAATANRWPQLRQRPSRRRQKRPLGRSQESPLPPRHLRNRNRKGLNCCPPNRRGRHRPRTPGLNLRWEKAAWRPVPPQAAAPPPMRIHPGRIGKRPLRPCRQQRPTTIATRRRNIPAGPGNWDSKAPCCCRSGSIRTAGSIMQKLPLRAGMRCWTTRPCAP